MVFFGLQREIEKLYALSTLPNVEDFLISTPQLHDLAPLKEDRPQMLLSQGEDELCISVHLGDAVRERIETQGLFAAKLEDFCVAAEEISHFIFVSFRAQLGKPVSMLDIEVQAEIDKFILATKYFPEESELFERMFERIHFRDDLDPTEAQRYREANRLAAKMAIHIQKRLEPELDGGLYGFLRDFYRLETQRRLFKVEKLGGM